MHIFISLIFKTNHQPITDKRTSAHSELEVDTICMAKWEHTAHKGTFNKGSLLIKRVLGETVNDYNISDLSPLMVKC